MYVQNWILKHRIQNWKSPFLSPSSKREILCNNEAQTIIFSYICVWALECLSLLIQTTTKRYPVFSYLESVTPSLMTIGFPSSFSILIISVCSLSRSAGHQAAQNEAGTPRLRMAGPLGDSGKHNLTSLSFCLWKLVNDASPRCLR